MNFTILALSLAIADGGSSADYQFAPSDDRAELERGEWLVVGVILRGHDEPKEVLEMYDLRMVFRGNTITQKASGAAPRTLDSTYKLNPAAMPKQIDWGDGPKLSPAIYELNGDTLKIALGHDGRPKGFTADRNST